MTIPIRNLVGALGLAVVFQAAGATGDVEAGRAIYQEGRLPSGKPLIGKRFGTETVVGERAACAACHGRSGMGAVEGDITIAPITGKALFNGSERVVATMDPRRGKAFNPLHPPYTEASLARAVREGVHVTGRPMHRLMPRYELAEDEMRALDAYLGQLSVAWSPGVSADRIDFATVIAPGVDPARREVFIDMVKAAVAGKNGSTRPGRRYMAPAAELMLKTGRTWNFDIWQLSGPPETWDAQLAAFYRQKPVFAIVSGLSESTWEPIDAFCRREAIPCLLPSIDLPPERAGGYYPVYFSRGVGLEGEILATYLRGADRNAPRRLVQIFSKGAVGEGAAQVVADRLGRSGVEVENRGLERVTASDLALAMTGLGRDDAVVFWLRGGQLGLLKSVAVPEVADAFFSGRLTDGQAEAIPDNWKGRAKLLYPFELPDKRRANSAYLHAWLKLRKLPVVSEPMQSEVFFALNFVSETVSDMLDNLYRDYLIERTVNMMAFREGSKAEQEVRDRGALGRVTLRGNNSPGAALEESRELLTLARMEKGRGSQGGTTVYPRLSLGAGQRFASKGGYVVRIDGANGNALVPVTDWMVP
ncbi:MAG: c-type cytochrome [Actinomycetota bacterium]